MRAQLASVDDSGKKRRATYMIAKPEQKAKIGKYAAEIGTTKAIRHFAKDMPAMFKRKYSERVEDHLLT